MIADAWNVGPRFSTTIGFKKGEIGRRIPQEEYYRPPHPPPPPPQLPDVLNAQ